MMKRILCVWCVCMMFCFVGCAATPTAVDTAVPRSEIEVDWVDGISYSWDSLSKVADCIVEADVTAVDSSTVYGLEAMMIDKLAVRTVLKGKLSGEIFVQDTGLLEDNRERTLSGAPLMREGHRVVLFLESTDMVTAGGEPVYRTVGGLPLAKFFWDEDGTYHNALSYCEYVSDVTPFFDDTQPRTLREIKTLIK